MLKIIKRERLIRLVKKFKGRKILVVGDLFLDEYIYGLTTRVSREAPVLILKHDKTEYSLGGAANAINNLHTLGASVFPVGFIGDDEGGKKLIAIFNKKGIPIDGLVVDPKINTVTKTRIMAGGKNIIKQQVIRIDRENNVKLDISTIKKLLKILKKKLEDAEGVIFSDYGYGMGDISGLRAMLSDFYKKGGIFSVDTRFGLLKLKDLTTATPNESEIEESLGQKFNGDTDKLKQAGLKVLEKISADFLLITRGSKGMLLLKPDGESHIIPIVGSEEIVDVTGAGDTVISILTCSLCAGGNSLEAAHIANFGGDIVVMKSRTATASPREIIESIKKHDRFED